MMDKLFQATAVLVLVHLPGSQLQTTTPMPGTGSNSFFGSMNAALYSGYMAAGGTGGSGTAASSGTWNILDSSMPLRNWPVGSGFDVMPTSTPAPPVNENAVPMAPTTPAPYYNWGGPTPPPTGQYYNWGAPTPAPPQQYYNWGVPTPAPAQQYYNWGAPTPAPPQQYYNWGAPTPAPPQQYYNWGAPTPAPPQQYYNWGAPTPAPQYNWGAPNPAPSVSQSGPEYLQQLLKSMPPFSVQDVPVVMSRLRAVKAQMNAAGRTMTPQDVGQVLLDYQSSKVASGQYPSAAGSSNFPTFPSSSGAGFPSTSGASLNSNSLSQAFSNFFSSSGQSSSLLSQASPTAGFPNYNFPAALPSPTTTPAPPKVPEFIIPQYFPEQHGILATGGRGTILKPQPNPAAILQKRMQEQAQRIRTMMLEAQRRSQLALQRSMATNPFNMASRAPASNPLASIFRPLAPSVAPTSQWPPAQSPALLASNLMKAMRPASQALASPQAGAGSMQNLLKAFMPNSNPANRPAAPTAPSPSAQGVNLAGLMRQMLPPGGSNPLLNQLMASLARNSGQPTIGQPSIGQPTIGQPSIGQPTVGQPSSGQPTFGAPQTNAVQPPAQQQGVNPMLKLMQSMMGQSGTPSLTAPTNTNSANPQNSVQTPNKQGVNPMLELMQSMTGQQSGGPVLPGSSNTNNANPQNSVQTPNKQANPSPQNNQVARMRAMMQQRLRQLQLQQQRQLQLQRQRQLQQQRQQQLQRQQQQQQGQGGMTSFMNNPMMMMALMGGEF